VGLSHDNFTLIESSDFSLLRGTITGLVGTNGAGKTSLAKVIASKELPGFPKDRLTIQYVSSHENSDKRHEHNDSWSKKNANDLTPEAYLHLTVQERIDLLQAEIDTLEDLMDSQDDEQVEEMANRLAELYEVHDDVKESLEREIQQILTALEFGPHLKKKLSQLSLGWQYKCRLAAAFTTHPDVSRPCVDGLVRSKNQASGQVWKNHGRPYFSQGSPPGKTVRSNVVSEFRQSVIVFVPLWL
jgi:ATP-binding cassette, subfamily F, member 3